MAPTTCVQTEMPQSLRKTGISLVPETNWGTNICMFYEIKADLLEATAEFFAAGLKKNELCVWAVSNPVTELDARNALGSVIPDLDRHETVGNLEISWGEEWSLKKDEFNLQRITGGWTVRLLQALERGYAGLRISGNASWLDSDHWQGCEYDQELDRSVAGRQIIVLCTHALGSTLALELSDIVRAHHFTIARRNAKWEFVDTSEPDRVAKQVTEPKFPADSISYGFNTSETPLTHRETTVLALIVRGVSSRKIAELLKISPRTIDYHRANIMQKFNVRNVAELVHTVMRKQRLLDMIQPA